jgi:copper chaperone CopZ
MKSINQIVMLMAFMALFTLASEASTIKNAKTETVKVYGNCGMCKTRIEKAANVKGIASGVWNPDTKLLELTYNTQKTTSDEILKRVAYAGHDNDKYRAPEEAYAQLPACCKYERTLKTQVSMPVTNNALKATAQDSSMGKMSGDKQSTNQPDFILSEVYIAYFSLKDALAQDNGKSASTFGAALFTAIDKLPMEKLSMDQHMVWMKYEKQLSYDAEHIKSTTDTDHQREHFVSLSKNMYMVMKTIPLAKPVYFDFCPMANEGKGANWLSLDEKISNPYMGSKMPTCGKVQETIK